MTHSTTTTISIEDIKPDAVDSFLCILAVNLTSSQFEDAFGDSKENVLKDLSTAFFEIEVEVSGSSVPYYAATYNDPEEGGYFEDVSIMLCTNKESIEISDYITKRADDKLNEILAEDCAESQRDAYEYAQECRYEALRDRED